MNNILKSRIELIKLFLTLSGKSKIESVIISCNIHDDEKILITHNGVTRWYNPNLYNKEIIWDKCNEYIINSAFISIEPLIKRFFGI